MSAGDLWNIPDSWRWTEISQLGDIVSGGTPSSKNIEYWDGDINWISPADLKGYTRKIICSGRKSITKAGLDNCSAKLMPAGSIHFSSRAPVGYVVMGGDSISTNQGFKSLVPVSSIFNEYVYYYLKSSKQLAEKRASGTTFLELSGKAFGSLPLPLPPLDEQKRIVAKVEALFSELDSGIVALKSAREQLKVYRQAVLKHAFDGKLTAQWREDNADKLETPELLLARIPAPQQPRGGRKASVEVIAGIAALAVNKPPKRQPEGWQWVPLLRVARQETGHTPSRKYPEYWGGDEHWVGIADARQYHGQVINDTIQKVTPAGLKNSSARILPADTVVMSRTASVGYTAIMGKAMSTSQDFATWTCTDALHPKFLMYAIMAEGNEIKRFGKGTTHTTIYFPEIRALHICLPSMQEQKVIIDSVESALQQTTRTLEDIDTQLARAETLRQSILKKAFAGELVAQNPDDEPASELLARIKQEKAERQAANQAAKKAQKAANKKPAATCSAKASRTSVARHA